LKNNSQNRKGFLGGKLRAKVAAASPLAGDVEICLPQADVCCAKIPDIEFNVAEVL
jgi:hypothetical protein